MKFVIRFFIIFLFLKINLFSEEISLVTYIDYLYINKSDSAFVYNPMISPYYDNSLPVHWHWNYLPSNEHFYKGKGYYEYYFDIVDNMRLSFGGIGKIQYKDEFADRLNGTILTKLNFKFKGGEMVQQFRVFKDPNPTYNYRIRPWKGALLKLEEAYLHYTISKKVGFSVGRFYQNWAPFPFESLIISSKNYAWDGFSYSLKWRKMVFTYLYSWLNDLVIDGVTYKRYLAAHRVDWRILPFIIISASEVAVYSDNAMFWGYVFPFFPFYATQWDERQNDNLLTALDIYAFYNNWAIYVQFLIDDMMYEDDPAPDKIGVLFGIKNYIELNNGMLEFYLYYQRITKWTYSHITLCNRYTIGDTYIGNSMGADADELHATIIWEKNFIKWENGVVIGRYGEGNDFENTAVPFIWHQDNPNVPFPFGIVTKKFGFESIFLYNYEDYFQFFFKINNEYFYNYQHINGKYYKKTDFSVGIIFNRL